MKRWLVLGLLLLLSVTPGWAVNDIDTSKDAAVTWINTGGSEQLDLGDGVIGVSGAVGCGSYHDWADDPIPTHYYIELNIDGFDTAPVVNESVDLYISMGETTSLFTGPESLNDTADSTGSTARLPNLLYVGSVVVWSTTAGNNLVGSFFVEVKARYWAPCVHNRTADNFLTTGDAHSITVYPVKPQIQ